MKSFISTLCICPIVPEMFLLSPIFLLLVVGTLALPSRDFDDQEVDFFRADSGSTRAPKCIAARPCVSNADCAGEGQGNQPGKPWCAGSLAGVCDCAACVGGMVFIHILTQIHFILALQG